MHSTHSSQLPLSQWVQLMRRFAFSFLNLVSSFLISRAMTEKSAFFISVTLRYDSVVQRHLTAWQFCKGGGGVRLIPAWFLYLENNNYNKLMTIFTELSLWLTAIARAHRVHMMNADSSPDGCQPQTKPINLGCESAGSCYCPHPLSPFAIITQWKLMLILPSCREWKAESLQDTN